MKRIDLQYPSEPRYVYEVRRLFQEFLRGAPVSADELEDLKIALSEACANAIAHGSPSGTRSHFSVRCRLTPDELVMEVADEGDGFSPRPGVPLPDDYSPSGRGIFLMQHFCDDVHVERRDGGKAVILTKRLRHSDLEPEPVFNQRTRPSARNHAHHGNMASAPMSA
jgi:serine/threonine-protein kinase RsbW